MPGVFQKGVDGAVLLGHPLPPDLSDEEKKACDQLAHSGSEGGENKFFYAFFMGTRPQTLTGLADSPVGLGESRKASRATTFSTTSRTSGSRTPGFPRPAFYWEVVRSGTSFFDVKGVKLPVAVSVFPDELYEAPKSWAQKAYPELIHYNKLPKGGHFAAWEQPELLVGELRAGVRSLR
jgi:hypothetical protein